MFIKSIIPLILCLLTICSLKLHAQIGIGTTAPELSAVFELKTTTKGFLPPRMSLASRNLINSPAEGLVIFNTTEKCINFFDGSNWVSLCNSVQSSTLVLSSFSGASSLISNPKSINLTQLVTLTDDSSFQVSIPYTVLTAGDYSPISISSTGVNGLFADAEAGNISSDGNFIVDITGTPDQGGSADFEIELGGLTTNFTIPVTTAPSITMILCSTDKPTFVGNPLENNKTVPANNDTYLRVRYTGGNGLAYPSESIVSTGVTGLTASVASGVLATGNGEIKFIISGTPVGSGIATFPISFLGLNNTTCDGGELNVTVLPTQLILTTLDASNKSILNPNTINLTNSTTLTTSNDYQVSIPYTVTTAGVHPAISVSSTGVTGLTASHASGTITSDGNLVLDITGTPSSDGIASFEVTIGGLTETFTLPIAQTSLVLATLDATNKSILNPNTINLTNSTTLTTSNDYQVSVPYTVTTAGVHPAISVSSTGVTGLTASHASGTITSDGNLVLDITGTPSSDGIASFEVTIGGLTETFTLPIAQTPLVLATLDASNKSILNPNTINLTNSTTLTTSNDYQVSVPYTVTTAGVHPAISVSSTGVTGLTASHASGTITSDGNLVLDITGTPSSDGIASFEVTIGGLTETFTLPIAQTPLVLATLDEANKSIINPNTIILEDTVALTVSSNYQVSIPYTVTSPGAHPALSISSTGVTGLTASHASGTITTDGNLVLDITGTPSTDGTASFEVTIGGITETFTLTVLPVPIITTIRCGTSKPKFFGSNLVENLAIPNDNNTYIRVRYTGGNNKVFNSESISSTGVTGLTATVASGTLATGNGEVLFIISGTPSGSGTATFPISFLGKSNSSCQGGELDVTVNQAPLVLATLDAANKSIINPNSIIFNDTVALITSDNYQVSIPFTVTTPGIHPAIAVTSTGVTGLTASHASGTITTDGNLVLDITGTPSTDGTASFEVTIGGITETFTLTVEPAPIIATIRCSTSKPKFFGDNLVENVVIPNDNNTYIRVRYTGGNNKVFNSESISSTGVTGLTATVASGTLATGNGEVLFIISGTPSSSGTATFPISFLGVSNSSCQGGELDVTVDPAPVAINNLNCGSSSILNPNTIDLTDATTLTSGDNYQVRIPFTITSAGVHSAISISSTGVTGLTATAASGTITSDGNLDLSITGTPSGDGTASFALSLGGQSCSFDLTVTIAPTPTISNIRCSNHKPKFFGNTLVENTLVPNDNNTYIRVRYADGNGLAFGSESISSTGVTGLTATVAAGTLATGNGEVEFIISGTPSGSGTATFPISFLGVSNSSCQGGELDIPVSSAQLVLATLNVGSMSILNPNSIILDDTATLVSNNNYQVSIPFTVTNAGNHPAISVASTGVTGLTASHASGTITTDGNLVLDITGTPSTDGTASFEVTIGGITETFTLTVVPAPIIATIRCGTSKPKFFGNSLIDNSAVPNDNNTYIRVRYTSGNGKAFNSESISSTGVTGLTATVASGTLATGNGEVLFIISGTPSGSGTATFPISFLGVSNASCQGGELDIPVDEAQLVVNNLNCGSSSILNPNTIDLTDATTLTSGDNYQVRIPFTITSAGVHSAISISSTGVTGLTATAASGTISSNGNLDLTITGTPSGDGTASFALSYGGQSCTFTLAISVAPTPIITSIRCSNHKPKFFGNTLVENTLVPNDNNTYIRVRYAGGNGLAFGSESITSTGVTGLTATVAAGTLAIGNGEVLFIISGTPSGSGTATFPISFLGVSNTGCVGGELDVTVDAIPPIITGIRCSGNKPTYLGAAITEGDNILSSANNRIRVRYEGGNGADFSSESINSTGVTGLTATVVSGSLANGNGEVLFIISGTPSSSGNAVFPISFLGVNSTCDDGNVTLPITSAAPPVLPSNITLTAGQKAYIASIYDADYLPYTAPTSVASTGSSSPGNPSTEPTINIQGRLTTTGVNIRIPYVVTGGGNVSLPAFSQTRTVISDHVQGSANASNAGGGNPVDVRLSYSAQTVSGSGYIIAKIRSVGSNLKAVKLDINKGIGTDLGILLAEFTIATNSSGGTGNIQLKDIPGIPDRRFGEITTQGGVSGQYHNNLYLPVQATDGRIWLNNNLGANYADLSHDNFNPAQSALTKSDHNAYGSLYQWGRYSDGHELIDYTNGTTGAGVNGITGGPIPTPTPNHNLFVKPSLNDWLSTVNNSLWQGVNGQNNPCPEGFRLPDNDEFSALMTALNFDNTGFSSSHVVKFPFPGFRVNVSSTAGGINMESFQGYYQTSTVLSGGTTIRVHHLNEGHNMSQGAKKGGWSVRCIQD